MAGACAIKSDSILPITLALVVVPITLRAGDPAKFSVLNNIILHAMHALL
jgi:hypothetical protein